MSKKTTDKFRHEKKMEMLKDRCVWEMRSGKDNKPHMSSEEARYTTNGYKRAQFQPNTHKTYSGDNRQLHNKKKHFDSSAINVNIGEGEFVLFDDIEANWSANMRSRRQKQQQYNEFTQQQKPLYQQQLKHHHHQDMLKMTKMIGQMPIAEYEGSPRRFGNQPMTTATTTTTMLSKRAPGFPQRVSPKMDNHLLQQVSGRQQQTAAAGAVVGNLIDIDDENCIGAVGGHLNSDNIDEFFQPNNELHERYRYKNNSDSMHGFYHSYRNYDQDCVEEKHVEEYIGQRLAQLPQQSELYLVHQSPMKQVKFNFQVCFYSSVIHNIFISNLRIKRKIIEVLKMANSIQLSYDDSASEEIIFNTFEYQQKKLGSLAAQKCQPRVYRVPQNSKASMFFDSAKQSNVTEVAGRVNMPLKDLLQISLGTDKLTDTNFAVLYSLLNILLKKLGCENEVVSIGGFEGQCVKKLLDQSKPSPLPFNAESVDILADKIEQIEITQQKVDELSKHFDKHMQDIERCRNVPPLILNFDEWEAYNLPCEDTYIRCDPDNAVACELLHNTDFLRKLMRRIAFPMVQRIFELEGKIKRLGQKLDEFIEELRQQFEKLVLMEGIIAELEKVKEQMHENYLKFIGAMEEIQDMLDSKLDKIHMPALKQYLKESFENIQKVLDELKAEHDCSKAAGVIMNGLTCVSCGNSKVCSKVDEIPVANLRSVGVVCIDPQKYKKRCSCSLSMKSCEPRLKQRIEFINTENVKMRVESGNCINEVHLIPGIDGNLYRGDAKLDEL